MKKIKHAVWSWLVFHKNMFTSGNDASTKRYIAYLSTVALIVLAAVNQFFALDVKDTFICAFAGLAGLQTTLSIFEKKK